MIANRNFGNYDPCPPLTWIGKVPVYLATALAIAQAVAMVLTTILMASLGSTLVAASGESAKLVNPVLGQLVFSFRDVTNHFALWQYVTYAFVNPPTLGFVVQLFMFAWFGRDVEKFLGRKSFALLYLLLLLAVPAFLSLVGLVGGNLPYFGSGALHFSIFLAFALIYPRAEIFFGIEARWIAMILVGIFSLGYIAFHQWVDLAMLWWGFGVAAAWLKYEGVASLQTPALDDYLQRRQSAKHLKLVKPAPRKESGLHESIDPILDKIAKQGIGSLSRGERDKLERARAALLEKERQN